MKVIETLWFTNLDGAAGIVIVEEDVTGDRKAYIGPATGHDEKADIDKILAWGSKFSLDTTQRILHHLQKAAPPLTEADLVKIREALEKETLAGALTAMEEVLAYLRYKGGEDGSKENAL